MLTYDHSSSVRASCDGCLQELDDHVHVVGSHECLDEADAASAYAEYERWLTAEPGRRYT